MNALTLTLLWISGLLFVALGLHGLFNPVGHMAMFPVVLETPAALGEVRANYGGMHLALGLLFVYGALRAAWQLPALAVLALFTGGLALGRVLSLALDGAPAAFVYGFTAIEVISAALALWLLRTAVRPVHA